MMTRKFINLFQATSLPLMCFLRRAFWPQLRWRDGGGGRAACILCAVAEGSGLLELRRIPVAKRLRASWDRRSCWWNRVLPGLLRPEQFSIADGSLKSLLGAAPPRYFGQYSPLPGRYRNYPAPG